MAVLRRKLLFLIWIEASEGWLLSRAHCLPSASFISNCQNQRNVHRPDVSFLSSSSPCNNQLRSPLSYFDGASYRVSIHKNGRTRRMMALVPLPVEDLDDLLVVGTPSGLQYAAYWGRTKREQYGRFFESSVVAFIGVFFSYFLSFVLGGFVATIFGALFGFWAVLSPDFKARQRNWEFLGGRPLVDPWIVNDRNNVHEGLYGSLLLGRIDDVCVVEDTASLEEYDLDDFQDYTCEDDELEQIAGTPYMIRVRVSDDEGRELQIHARLSEEYLGIKAGMPMAGILLSQSQSFSTLAALTDIYVPDADCFVGDYPYLNRPEMEALLADDDDLWRMLQAQGKGKFYNVPSAERNNDDDDDGVADSQGAFQSDETIKVPVRRRR